MQGFPKHLNSKFDYEYVRNNFPKEQWAPLFEELLAGQKTWICAAELTDGATGITDETHKVIESTDTAGATTKYQYEYVDDTNCEMIRLGYTTEEINSILS